MGTEIWADSCSPEDIQDAVDYVNGEGGGTVRLLAETGIFSNETITIPGSVSVIGSGTANTILEQTQAAPFNVMFYLDGANALPTRISGIQFEGLVTSSEDDVIGVAIQVFRGINFRIDHCKYTDFPQTAIGIGNHYENYLQPKGVIDHCNIDNPYKDVYGGAWGYGIIISGHYIHWYSDITTYLGKYDTIPTDVAVAYIEDNTFRRCRHSIASNQAAWYIARYNDVGEARAKNWGQIDVHGQSGPTAPGGRGFEVYGNELHASEGYTAYTSHVLPKGGGGAIFNNTFINNAAGQTGIDIMRDGTIPEYQVYQLYIWDNTINIGSLILNRGEYTEDVDFFLRAPNQEQDGFTYTPYTYPHPLTGNGNGNGLVQRKMLLQNLRFVLGS